ncbi:MAG: hypothetical protein ACN4G0_13305 [Polyangiales bacterium]
MRVLIGLLVTAAVLGTAGFALGDTEPMVVATDRLRIQGHLASVESYLRAQGTRHLTPAQREARGRAIVDLREYREAGVFPRNTFAGHPIPVFIDSADRACAVGYLMIASGWSTEADRIAARENFAYVNDMRSPEVGEWLSYSGLTPQEAAWIQPQYEWCGSDCSCDEEPVCGADGTTFLNPCVAEACGGQTAYVDGCCTPGDGEPVQVWLADACRCRSGIGGFELDERCADDPDYARGADLCGELVAPPSAAANPGCAAAPHPTPFKQTLFLLTCLTLLAASRRRPRRRRHLRER